MRKYVAIIEWHDGESNDADEIAVFAESVAAAKRKARAEWRRRHGRAWPAARIAEVVVLTPGQFRGVVANL